MSPEYAPGLRDLDRFSHLILLCHLHLTTGYALDVMPYLDTATHGVFATRSPKRPNAIGFSVVRLVGIDGATLAIADVDMLDGTPLLDLKPYVPAFDHREAARTGWLEENADKAHTTRADERLRCSHSHARRFSLCAQMFRDYFVTDHRIVP